jgi:2-polyprenyl-3-methyl-5-hydroxy-6-metoxy-1,4-benzoquinol methylase
MSVLQKIFSRMYRRAQSPASLPWHREEPPSLLPRATSQHTPMDRALDLGCGEGVSSVFLASKGFKVTGVDFVPEALALARERARTAGVDVELIQSDVLDYSPPTGFDIVLDRLPPPRSGEERPGLSAKAGPLALARR